ncbi:zincin [Trichodelitschia bisporula]|uniref:Disintegrin and metalloproteinase domain-containing protein B n=1 Tax=Trichodelitschia bisporula TaxID=703511 RepID=A0A6G1IA02_9PEZI|nr:zincin [Trichodelitschia bisporula]
MIPSQGLRASRASALLLLLVLASFAAASSVARNPLSRITLVRNAVIDAPGRKVTALSHFSLRFEAFDSDVRLALEPNHDILPEGATVRYLGEDGEVERTEVVDRLAHRVFLGDAWVRKGSGWEKVGWARATVHKDGEEPVFDGVFAVGRDNYHVQLRENWDATRLAADPVLEEGEGRMVLRKRDVDLGCPADRLDFNMDPLHPVYSGIDDEDAFWSTPVSHLFGKRQMDTGTGAGNTGGVNLASTIGQTAGCPSTRKVALVGVATDCAYTASFTSADLAKSNIISQMNSASSLYERTFNISLGLANLIVSNAKCPASAPDSARWNQPCAATGVDIQERLNLFSAWRGTQQDNYSHWTLLTNCPTGSAVGLAWLGQACVQAADSRNATQAGAGKQTVSGANVVARTNTEWQVIAHETGHTFGAVHDCTSDTCTDGTSKAQQCCPLTSATCDAGEKYIMNPSTVQGITSFSPCSIGNICSAMGRNSVKSFCLSNNKGVTTITGQQCGNGIVEPGEDCDCGGTTGCGNNACCDPTTCKFKSGAVCDDANEECCRSCQLAPAGAVCRASTGVCDPQETCTGADPLCPADTTAPDGQGCGSGLKCASGHCTSRDLQCKTLMGGYTTGNDTYACDSQTCTLSCASPEFGSGVCYGLQQNFLDGTPCGGGGKCSNGACKGSNFGKEIKSWIDDHRPLVIGISAAVGGLILLMIISCIWRSFKSRKMRRNRKPLNSGCRHRDGIDAGGAAIDR